MKYLVQYSLLAFLLLFWLGCSEDSGVSENKQALEEYNPAQPPSTPSHPIDTLHFPTSVVVSADQRHLHVVNTNFDLKHDSGAILTIDLDTHRFVEKGVLFVPNFVGDLVLRPTLDGKANGYLPDRESGALLWFHVDINSPQVFTCQGEDSVEGCSDDNRVTTGILDGELTRMEQDPYAIGLVPGNEGASDSLITGGLLDPQLSVWSLDVDGKPTLTDQRSVANGLSSVTTHPTTHTAYVTSQYSQAIFAIDLEEEDPLTGSTSQGASIDDVQVVALPNDGLGGRPVYGQHAAFDNTGGLAFVAYRYPASVVVVDVSPDTTGKPTHTPIAFIDVGSGPSHLAYLPGEDGSPGLLYVVCSGADALYVIDVASLSLVDVISIGRSPARIALVKDTRLNTHRAYISLFEEHAIAVVDITPGSPWYHQLIATIR